MPSSNTSDRNKRCWLCRGKQRIQLLWQINDCFCHAIVQNPCDLLLYIMGYCAWVNSLELVAYASFDTFDVVHAAALGNIGGLG